MGAPELFTLRKIWQYCSFHSNIFELNESMRSAPHLFDWLDKFMVEVGKMFTKADWLIFAAAFFSFLFSVSLWFGFGMTASKEAGMFVGLWVPSILSAGIYVRQAVKGMSNV